jgi:hypothetical protein
MKSLCVYGLCLNMKRIPADADVLLPPISKAARVQQRRRAYNQRGTDLRIHEGQRLALPERRGLIPSCSKVGKIAQHTFSARGETVAENPFPGRVQLVALPRAGK